MAECRTDTGVILKAVHDMAYIGHCGGPLGSSGNGSWSEIDQPEAVNEAR